MVSIVFPDDIDFTFPHTYFHVKPQQMDTFFSSWPGYTSYVCSIACGVGCISYPVLRFFTLSVLCIKHAMSLPFWSNSHIHSHTEWVLEKNQQYWKFFRIFTYSLFLFPLLIILFFHIFVLFSLFLHAIWELFRQILNRVDPEALNMAIFLPFNVKVR